MDAILKEADACGERLFHNLVDLVDIEAANKQFQVDDQMMSFTMLDNINIKTSIRVFGVVQSWFVKEILLRTDL